MVCVWTSLISRHIFYLLEGLLLTSRAILLRMKGEIGSEMFDVCCIFPIYIVGDKLYGGCESGGHYVLIR